MNNPKGVVAQINEGLRGVRQDNPVLVAVNALLDYQVEIADQATLEDGISPDRRAYLAGKEAGIKLVRSSLAIMHSAANKDQ